MPTKRMRREMVAWLSSAACPTAAPRRWVWRMYPASHAAYRSLWTLLESLSAKARWESGNADPYVEIWENETDEGGFGGTTNTLEPDLINYTNLKWTRVRFLLVSRRSRRGGDLPCSEESLVEFSVDDAGYRVA